jgi:acetyl-CoA acetyltransferase
MTDVFIVGGARTPMTEYSGALKDLSALELGAVAARAAFERTGIRPEWVDHAVVGNVMQTSSDAIYGARHVALRAGVPIEVPALTVNRLCGSGIQAAVSGAQLIQLGEADIVLAGGRM